MRRPVPEQLERDRADVLHRSPHLETTAGHRLEQGRLIGRADVEHLADHGLVLLPDRDHRGPPLDQVRRLIERGDIVPAFRAL